MKKNISKADELQSLTFPADFIAEYVGQVRAWFYVMHVLGVLLMSKADTDTQTEDTMEDKNIRNNTNV